MFCTVPSRYSRIHLGKTGACYVLIFGSEVIYLLTIYVFSSGNCLPLVLLIQQHVQQLQNPNPIYQQVTKQRSSVPLLAEQASPQISNWQNSSGFANKQLGQYRDCLAHEWHQFTGLCLSQYSSSTNRVCSCVSSESREISTGAHNRHLWNK